MATNPAPATPPGILLHTAYLRWFAHVVVAFFAAFAPLLWYANEPLTKAVVIGAIAAGSRAALGAVTSTNPGVGKNLI